MQVKTFLFTLSAGMVAGATAMLMLPTQNSVRKAAQKAADSMEDAVSKCTNSMAN